MIGFLWLVLTIFVPILAYLGYLRFSAAPIAPGDTMALERRKRQKTLFLALLGVAVVLLAGFGFFRLGA